MLVLFGLSLFIFVLPFAFPTPPPIITRFTSTAVFSPNGDGRRDVARVNLRVHDASVVRLEITAGGRPVRTLLADKPLPVGWHSIRWDGRDDAGHRLPDGEYGIRLRARSGNKRFNTSRSITIDTATPRVAAFRVESATLGAPGVGECRVAFTATDAGTLTLAVLRPGATEPLAARGPRPAPAAGTVRWRWSGVARSGRPVPVGLYLVRARLTDGAGNRTARELTCWVGRIAGTVAPPRPAARTAVRVTLRATDGTPLDPATPVVLEFRRRTGIPGRTSTPPLGARVGARVTTRAGHAATVTPRGVNPAALWLVARTGDGEAVALIPLGGVE